MTREQVITAINGSDYQALLDIYKKYKINNKFDAFFSGEPDTMRQNMLIQKVKDIFRKLEQSGVFAKPVVEVPQITVKPLDFKKPAAKTKTIERVVIDSNPHVKREDLPEKLQKLYDENGKMYGEMKSKHAALKVELKEEKRKALVCCLSEYEDMINHNWSVIDKWYQDFKEGKLQQEKTEDDPVLIANKIGAAKRYLGRYSKSTKPAQVEKCKEYAEFLNNLNIKFTIK